MLQAKEELLQLTYILCSVRTVFMGLSWQNNPFLDSSFLWEQSIYPCDLPKKATLSILCLENRHGFKVGGDVIPLNKIIILGGETVQLQKLAINKYCLNTVMRVRGVQGE